MRKTLTGKKLLSLLLSVLMCFSVIPTVVFATAAEGEAETLTNYLTVSGISGFENESFESFEAAYNKIKPEIEKSIGLRQDSGTAEKFDALFTDRDENGDAKLTYTVHGKLTYDETGLSNLISMGKQRLII